MSNQYGTVWVDVRGDTRNLDRDVGSWASSAGSALGSVGKTVVSDIGRVTAQVATGLTVMGAAGATSLLSVGSAYNTLEQSSLAAFETLLGTSQAAQDMQASVREFAKTSPFPRQAFIEGTQQLLAFGFEAEQIIPTLSAIQDAVAAAGGGAPEIDRITGILAKIRASAKFSIQELNQLGEAGINAGKVIADQLGVTEEEFRDSFFGNPARGQEAIDLIDTLVAGMSESFEGAADNLKNTFVGAKDRIAGAWRDLGSDLVQPFIAREGGGYAVDWANDIADALRTVQRNVLPALQPVIWDIAEGLSGAADAASDMAAKLSPARAVAAVRSIERGVRELRSTFEGLEGVAVGAGIAIAGLGARSVLGPLGFLVPAISPITGILGGLVAGSEDGRQALQSLGGQASDFARGPGSDLLGALSGFIAEVEGPFARGMETVGSALIGLGESVAPMLGRALDQLGERIGRLIDAGSELVAQVLEEIGTLAGAVLPPAIDILSSGLGVAASALELLADNAWLVVPALTAIVTARSWDRLSGLGGGLMDAARNVGSAVQDFSTHFQVLRAEGETVRGSFRGAAGATGGLMGALGKINPVLVGVTAAVGLGTIAYQRYAENKGRVTDISADLTEALKLEADAFRRSADARARQAFLDKGGLEAANELGVTMSELISLAGQYGDEISGLDAKFAGGLGNALDPDRYDNVRRSLESLPEPVRDIAEQMLTLNENGEVGYQQVVRFFEALDELAQGTTETVAEARAEFESIAREAFSEGIISGDQLAQVLDDIAKAKTPDQLNEAFNRLSGLLGETESAAEKAKNELRGVLDVLDEFVDAPRNVDEASRRYVEAIARMLDFDDDGNASADAIQAAVEAAERLAAAQALVDTTGESSRLTLNSIAIQLRDLAEAGAISQSEYRGMLELYGLTPARIDTFVAIEVAEAEEKLDELRGRLDELENEDPDIRRNILALIDEGKYAEAETALVFLERTRAAEVKAEADTSEADATLGNWWDRVRSNLVPTGVDADTDKADVTIGEWWRTVAERVTATQVDAKMTPADLTLGGWWNKVSGTTTFSPVDANTKPAVDRWNGLAGDLSESTMWSPFDLDTSPAQGSLGNLLDTWLGGIVFGGGIPGVTGRRALGGSVYPGDWLVGEEGPELLRLGPGVTGQVHSTAHTAAMLDRYAQQAPPAADTLTHDSTASRQLVTAVQRLEQAINSIPNEPTVHATYNQVEQAPTVDDLVWKLNVVRVPG